MAIVKKKTVLITGCSTGIGNAMTKVFHSRGFHVFATARDPSKTLRENDISALGDVEVLELDVTAPQTIARCRDVVAKRTGGTLDILVNNAGAESQGPLLDVDLVEARRLYEVNVWGPLAVVQEFAPLLVEAKGVVVNQSSIDAALSMAWAGKFPAASTPSLPGYVVLTQLASRHLRQFQGGLGAHLGDHAGRAGAARRARRDSHVRLRRYAHVRQAWREDESAGEFVLLRRPGGGIQRADGPPVPGHGRRRARQQAGRGDSRRGQGIGLAGSVGFARAVRYLGVPHVVHG